VITAELLDARGTDDVIGDFVGVSRPELLAVVHTDMILG